MRSFQCTSAPVHMCTNKNFEVLWSESSLPIQVLKDYDEEMNRYAFLMID